VRHWLGRPWLGGRWAELCGFATSATNGSIAGASFLVPGLAARPDARRSPCLLRDIRTGLRWTGAREERGAVRDGRPVAGVGPRC
jgi:hypothetical protein